MAAPFTKSGETIVQDFAAAAQSASKQPLNFSLGSVFTALGEAVASVADWLQKLYLFALLVSRLQTSRGAWVDSFCADYMPLVAGTNSPRLPAQASVGVVTFSRSTPQAQAIIPIGSVVTTYDGQTSFQVTADTNNPAYSATIIPGGGYVVQAGTASISVPVTALAVGSASNVSAGSITLMRSPLVGIDSVTNSVAISGGLDAESDDALKARFKLFILSLRAGTVDAIAYAVVSLRQGLQYAIHNNYLPDGTFSPGAVTVYVDDGTGNPPTSIISSATDAVNGIRAAGTRPSVIAATKLPANVEMTIATAAGYDHNTLVAAVGNAVGAYIQALQLEQTLRYSMLEHIAYSASPGVTNVSSVLLNNSTSDLVPSFGQTIKLGNTGVVVS